MVTDRYKAFSCPFSFARVHSYFVKCLPTITQPLIYLLFGIIGVVVELCSTQVLFWDIIISIHSLFKGGSCYPCSRWRFPSKYHFFQIPNYHKDELVLLKICNDLIFEKHKKVEFLHEMGGKSPK